MARSRAPAPFYLIGQSIGQLIGQLIDQVLIDQVAL
jgi:hypothetical protein